MDDKTLYVARSRWTLTVAEGPGLGTRHELPEPCALVIGRAADCDLPVDARDPKASRRHARISVAAGAVRIEDLQSTNGLFVDEARVLEAVLSPGARIRVGTTVLVLEQSGPEPAAAPGSGTAPYRMPDRTPGEGQEEPRLAPIPARPAPVPVWKRLTLRHWLYLCAGLSLLLLLVAIFSGSDQEPPAPASKAAGGTPSAPTAPAAAPAADQPSARKDQPDPPVAPAPRETAPPAPSSAPASGPAAPGPSGQASEKGQAQAEQSRELFRQAMFQYNAGNLRKALELLNQAKTLDPANEQASRWAVRAGTELDRLVDQHYRQGLLALKYMRRDEAAAELRFVVESAPDAGDERVRDARAKLAELEGKKP